MFGKLYIVATPIGNLEDMTLRALRVLKEVDLILAEDTRVTSKLLSHYEIDRPILTYQQHTSDAKKAEILGNLLTGKNIALVTDAGTPGISDPGNELIDFILQREALIQIIPIPGPSAITATLSVSGFRSDKFLFLGFMPKKGKTKLFQWLKDGQVTFVFYESPHRILKTLDLLGSEFGDVSVVVAREMTKIHESIYRGTPLEVKEKLLKDPVKGEIVVVVEGK